MRFTIAHQADDFVEASTYRPPADERRRRKRQLVRVLLGGAAPASWRRSEIQGARGILLAIAGLLLLIVSTAHLGVRVAAPWFGVSAVTLLFLAMVMGPFLISLTPWGVRREFAADSGNADSAVIEVDEEGFRFLALQWQCRLTWPAVRDLLETPNLFLVVDDTPNTFIVPKRDLARPGEAEAFRDLIHSHLAAAAG